MDLSASIRAAATIDQPLLPDLVGVGGATAVLMIVLGWLYSHFGAAAFWGMALLCVAALPVIWTLHGVLSPRTA
jgi:hypothetical protein